MIHKLFSPSIGVVMIRKELEKNLNKKIPVFEIQYISINNEKLFFEIDGIQYPYENAIMLKMIKEMLSKELKNGETLDIAKIKISEDNKITAVTYYRTSTGEKKFMETKI